MLSGYLLFLCLGTIWLSSCRRCTAVGHQERGGSSCRREETSCSTDTLVRKRLWEVAWCWDAPSPGRVAHTQRFLPVVPPRVWDLLVSRLGALKCGRSPRSPLPLPFGHPAVSLSSAPEGYVHQTLAAGSQLGIRAPAGRGGTGFGEEAEEAEEERDGNLGVSGGIGHLERRSGGDFSGFKPATFASHWKEED